MASLDRRLRTGHLVTPLDGKALLRYKSQWKGSQGDPVRITPGGVVGPKPIATVIDEIQNFKFRKHDVVVMTYPKCGTTWMQELVWTMKHNPTLDNPIASAPINVRSPHLELDSFNKTDGIIPPKPEDHTFLKKTAALFMKLLTQLCVIAVWAQIYLLYYCPKLIEVELRMAMLFDPAALSKMQRGIVKKNPKEIILYLNYIITNFFNSSKPIPGLLYRICEYSEGSRIIKTHLPFSLMPKNILDKCKVVYVMRNPKDMLVSYYYHCRLVKLHGFTGSFADFVQTFLDGDMMYGSYHLNLKDAFERQGHPNLLIVHYEELKRNNISEIKKINSFLETSLTDEQISKIAKYTSFEEMKGRDNMAGPSVEDSEQGAIFDANLAKEQGGFFRQGETGGWRSIIDPDMGRQLDEWIFQNCTQHGIEFFY